MEAPKVIHNHTDQKSDAAREDVERTSFFGTLRERRKTLDPSPRIRCGAWQQEICAARSLGKRVFCDKIKIATKLHELHYFGDFMEFKMLIHSLVLKLPTCGHSVMFT